MMKPKYKLAIHYLLANPLRTALVIIALFIGSWGLGSLLVSYTILKKDLASNFLKTRPPHAILISEDFDQLDLAGFRNRSDIESAGFRELSMERIEISPNEWVPLWLFGVEDFKHFKLAAFYREDGQPIPDSGTIIIERNGLKIYDLQIGTIARINVTGPKIVKVPISGTSYDPALAPATMEHWIYGYTDYHTYMNLTGQPMKRRLIVRFKMVKSQNEVLRKTQMIIDELSLL